MRLRVFPLPHTRQATQCNENLQHEKNVRQMCCFICNASLREVDMPRPLKKAIIQTRLEKNPL